MTAGGDAVVHSIEGVVLTPTPSVADVLTSLSSTGNMLYHIPN